MAHFLETSQLADFANCKETGSHFTQISVRVWVLIWIIIIFVIYFNSSQACQTIFILHILTIKSLLSLILAMLASYLMSRTVNLIYALYAFMMFKSFFFNGNSKKIFKNGKCEFNTVLTNLHSCPFKSSFTNPTSKRTIYKWYVSSGAL